MFQYEAMVRNQITLFAIALFFIPPVNPSTAHKVISRSNYILNHLIFNWMYYSKSDNSFHLLPHELCFFMLQIKMNELKFETGHRLNKDNLSNNYKMQSQRKPYYVMSKEQSVSIIYWSLNQKCFLSIEIMETLCSLLIT